MDSKLFCYTLCDADFNLFSLRTVAWFAGHLVLLLCIFRYTFSYISFNWYSTMGGLTYRTAFISAALTYGIVVYKTLKARQKVGQKNPGGAAGALQLLSDENVQYLGRLILNRRVTIWGKI